MTDPGDDKLARRYRELAREEPPASIDAAILAAGRRAVQARPRMRWAAPVSIAAVLVLGIGVALRMQVEQPGVETSAPQPAAPSEYSVPQAAEPVAKPDAAAAPGPAEARPAPRAKRVDPAIAQTPPPASPAPAPAPSPAPMPSDAPSAAAAQASAAPASAAAPPAPIAVPAESAATPAPAPLRAAQQAPKAIASTSMDTSEPSARLKREAFAADNAQARQEKEPRDEREMELERIARLRAEGRHGEADKALEEFRRRHPEYRIAPAMWERVKPR